MDQFQMGYLVEYYKDEVWEVSEPHLRKVLASREELVDMLSDMSVYVQRATAVQVRKFKMEHPEIKAVGF